MGALLLPRPLDFVLPAELEATEPVEVRTGRRDAVRLLVSRGDQPPTHERFTDLPSLLEPGDLLVVNTSRTLPAAVDGRLHPNSTPTLNPKMRAKPPLMWVGAQISGVRRSWCTSRPSCRPACGWSSCGRRGCRPVGR